MSTAVLLLEETERAQGIASDPAVSAWVSANAGAGKTHVLKMRVLRLLLQGIEPQRDFVFRGVRSIMLARRFRNHRVILAMPNRKRG